MENMRQPEDKWFTEGDLKLHYLDWGNSGATPMVLLHGHTGSAHYWDLFSQSMSQDYHVLAVDQRGHGDSSWTGNYAYKEYVADLTRFLDKLELNDIVLIGHSLGGLNSVVYASEHPDKVARLVVVDIGPEVPESTITETRSMLANQPDSFSSEEEAFQEMRRAHPYHSDDFIQHLLKHTMKHDDSGRLIYKYDPALRLVKIDSPQWLWPYLEQVVCPTLVVHGMESLLLLPEVARRMVEALPFGSLVDIERATHGVPGDNPEAFEMAVKQFLSGYSK